MVVDFDVHHGNGTQEIFEDDPRVLYVSSHAYPFYPGTGALDETGEGRGRGFTVNLPLGWPCGDAEYALLYRGVVEPLGRAYDPELLLVSAGFDAASGDPLAFMRMSAAGFAELTDVCLRISAGAARGRAVFVLEGGYSLGGLESGVAAVLPLLAGARHEPLGLAAAPEMRLLLEACRRRLAPAWPALALE
jgi:acetoin utilization deacetylase AcuC-like enzyme